MFEITLEHPVRMTAETLALLNGPYYSLIFPPTDVRTVVADLVSDPRSTVHELAKAIRSDQPIARRVVRAANCAFNGLNTPVECVRRAIVLLGLHRVRDIVLGGRDLGAAVKHNPRLVA